MTSIDELLSLSGEETPADSDAEITVLGFDKRQLLLHKRRDGIEAMNTQMLSKVKSYALEAAQRGKQDADATAAAALEEKRLEKRARQKAEEERQRAEEAKRRADAERKAAEGKRAAAFSSIARNALENHGVKWEWGNGECNDQFTEFSPDSRLELETAYQSLVLCGGDQVGVSLEVAGGGSYRIQVRADGKDMFQRNVTTDYTRPVRRHVTDAPVLSNAQTAAQSNALAGVRDKAGPASEDAKGSLLQVFREHLTSFDMRGLDSVLAFLRDRAALHINFKPRKSIGGQPLLDVMLQTPGLRYLTLFETGTGGGCTDQDERVAWERRMFPDVYEGGGSKYGLIRERPKYGYVNLLTHRAGDKEASSMYGKSYFVIDTVTNPELRRWVTITSRDSSDSKCRVGTLDACAHVLLDQLRECTCAAAQSSMVRMLAAAAVGKDVPLDVKVTTHYMEVQFHCDVVFSRDVMMVVADQKDRSADWQAWTKKTGKPVFMFTKDGMVPLS
jgi:hypothetical protein